MSPPQQMVKVAPRERNLNGNDKRRKSTCPGDVADHFPLRRMPIPLR